MSNVQRLEDDVWKDTPAHQILEGDVFRLGPNGPPHRAIKSAYMGSGHNDGWVIDSAPVKDGE